MSNFTESVVEDAALAWIESLGYAMPSEKQRKRGSP